MVPLNIIDCCSIYEIYRLLQWVSSFSGFIGRENCCNPCLQKFSKIRLFSVSFHTKSHCSFLISFIITLVYLCIADELPKELNEVLACLIMSSRCSCNLSRFVSLSGYVVSVLCWTAFINNSSYFQCLPPSRHYFLLTVRFFRIH